jgi:hypothetical protein
MSPIAVSTSTKARWSGWIIGGLPSLFLLVDATFKFIRPAPVLEATAKIGYPESSLVPIGVALLASTLLYLSPPTAVLGAILLTGYLGGAVATHARVSDPLFSHVLFPVYFGIMLWLGLYLRDRRLRELVPFRAPAGGTDAAG